MPLLLVTAGGIGLIAALAGYFFRPQAATVAGMGDNGQEVTVVLQGGYQPNLIHARTGTPLMRRYSIMTRRSRGHAALGSIM